MISNIFTKLKNSRKGFTLLEVLIVIVIISILSTVALVSLNGARIKAKNAKIDLHVRSYVLGLQSFGARSGQLPYMANCQPTGVPVMGNGGTLGVCLGEYPENDFGVGCGFFLKQSNSYSTFEDTTLNSQLLEEMGSLPSLDLISMSLPSQLSSSFENHIRGAIYMCTGFNLDGSVNEVKIRYFKIGSGRECLPSSIYETEFDLFDVSSCLLTVSS